MQPQRSKATVTGLGPRLTQPMTATGTGPLGGAASATGVLNLTISTTPVRVLKADDYGKGNARKVRLCVTPATSNNVAYLPVAKDATAPTITALGAGAATEGILLPNGGGIIETFDVADNLDLYLVASAAGTVIQFAVVDQ